MKYCTNCVSPSSAPLPGKTSSNGCYYALRQNKNIISASNSSPSHSLTLESFAQVKTCNQFIYKIWRKRWGVLSRPRKKPGYSATPRLTVPVHTVAIGLDGTCMLLCEEGYRQAMVGTISLYDRRGGGSRTPYRGGTPRNRQSAFLRRN